MPAGAAFCPACGCPLNVQGQVCNQNNWNNCNQNPYSAGYGEKDAGITIILGVLLGFFGIMGVGQIYAGRVGRGIVIMIGGFATVAASFITIFSYLSWWDVNSYDYYYYGPDLSMLIIIMAVIEVFHIAYLIWQAYDAYKLAKDYNEKLRMTGRPPW